MEIKQSLANAAPQCQAVRSRGWWPWLVTVTGDRDWWPCVTPAGLGSLTCRAVPSTPGSAGLGLALWILRGSRKNTGTNKATAPQTADTEVFEGCLVYYLLAFASKKTQTGLNVQDELWFWLRHDHRGSVVQEAKMGVRWRGEKIEPPILVAYTMQSNCRAGLQIPSSDVQLETFFIIPSSRRRSRNLYPKQLAPQFCSLTRIYLRALYILCGWYCWYHFGFPKLSVHGMPVWWIKSLKYFYIHFHINLRVDLPNLTCWK